MYDNPMCGRYALYETGELQDRYNLATRPSFLSADNYNVAPRQRLPVIIEREGQRTSELMQWGYIPPWSKDPSKGLRPINTKAESAFESSMWRNAALHHRILIPARGFYEWKRLADGRKLPYFIYPKEIPLFSFAGIYSVWHDVEGLPLMTFSIMTAAANKDMEPIHNRMPVMLHPDQETVWLDPANQDKTLLADLLAPYPNGQLDIYRVSPDVNSPRVNDPHLIEAAS